nr:MAG: capsid protein [Cressdnaviricota sp.]
MPIRRRTVRRRRRPRVRKMRSRHVKRANYTQRPYTFRRWTNMCDGLSTGLTVDNSVCVKTAKVLQFVIPSSSAVLFYGSAAFYAQLQDVVGYAEFSQLFDQYRINSVSLRIWPFQTSSETGAAAEGNLAQVSCLVHSVFDYDDVTLPTASDAGIDVLRQYPGYRCKQLINANGKALKYTFKPRLNVAVQNVGNTGSAGFNQTRSLPFGWVDLASPDASGYGLKLIFELPNPGAPTYGFNLYAKVEAVFNISFRQPR